MTVKSVSGEGEGAIPSGGFTLHGGRHEYLMMALFHLILNILKNKSKLSDTIGKPPGSSKATKNNTTEVCDTV